MNSIDNPSKPSNELYQQCLDIANRLYGLSDRIMEQAKQESSAQGADTIKDAIPEFAKLATDMQSAITPALYIPTTTLDTTPNAQSEGTVQQPAHERAR